MSDLHDGFRVTGEKPLDYLTVFLGSLIIGAVLSGIVITQFPELPANLGFTDSPNSNGDGVFKASAKAVSLGSLVSAVVVTAGVFAYRNFPRSK